jgi:hypothetical protein
MRGPSFTCVGNTSTAQRPDLTGRARGDAQPARIPAPDIRDQTRIGIVVATTRASHAESIAAITARLREAA